LQNCYDNIDETFTFLSGPFLSKRQFFKILVAIHRYFLDIRSFITWNQHTLGHIEILVIIKLKRHTKHRHGHRRQRNYEHVDTDNNFRK